MNQELHSQQVRHDGGGDDDDNIFLGSLIFTGKFRLVKFDAIRQRYKRKKFPKRRSEQFMNRDLACNPWQSRRNGRFDWSNEKWPQTVVLDIWVFPKIMVPPNHPFLHRVFHYKPSILGVKSPYFWFNIHIGDDISYPVMWGLKIRQSQKETIVFQPSIFQGLLLLLNFGEG